MKCVYCLKKPSILKCKSCQSMLCTSCIQLEIHSCKGMKENKEKELEKLKQQLPKVIASKVSAI